MADMERAEIKQVADYVKELKEGLVELGYDHIAMQTELPYLYQIIQRLMDATYKPEDQQIKPLLATLELHSRSRHKLSEVRTWLRNGKRRPEKSKKRLSETR